MLTFNPVAINGETYQARELTFGDGLKISIIDASQNERRLSEFLRCAYGVDPLLMTLEVRYYLLLDYLRQQTAGLYAIELDVQPYMRATGKPAGDHQLYPLTGSHLEYLERNCKNIAEWVACAMAIQLDAAGHDPLMQARSGEFEDWFIPRIEYVRSLPVSDFDALYDLYCERADVAIWGVDYTFGDNGVLLRGGTDDAPMRFCSTAALGRFIERLDSYYHG